MWEPFLQLCSYLIQHNEAFNSLALCDGWRDLGHHWFILYIHLICWVIFDIRDNKTSFVYIPLKCLVGCALWIEGYKNERVLMTPSTLSEENLRTGRKKREKVYFGLWNGAERRKENYCRDNRDENDEKRWGWKQKVLTGKKWMCRRKEDKRSPEPKQLVWLAGTSIIAALLIPPDT